jgi:hypothetical protein
MHRQGDDFNGHPFDDVKGGTDQYPKPSAVAGHWATSPIQKAATRNASTIRSSGCCRPLQHGVAPRRALGLGHGLRYRSGAPVACIGGMLETQSLIESTRFPLGRTTMLGSLAPPLT